MGNPVTAIQFAAEKCDALLGRFAYQASRCRKSPSAEAVHDLRVAIRRFRQALIVFGPCFAAKETKRIRRRLRALMSLAGEVRDCDVTAELVSKLGGAEAVPRSIRLRRKESVKRLVAGLRRSLDRNWSSKWRDRLKVGSSTDTTNYFRKSIEGLAGRILPKMVKGYFKSGNKAALRRTSPEDLHRFRIASKKLRYTVELFAPLYGASLTPFLNQLKAVQKLLGEANDCQTARNLLSRLDGSQSPEAMLRKRQRRKIRDFRELWTQEVATPANIRGWKAYLNDFDSRPALAKKPVGRSPGAALRGRKGKLA